MICMTIYDLFFGLFSLAYLPYLVIKGGAHKDFGQRFGRLPDDLRDTGRARPVWVHAVSVGEVLAVKDFLKALKAKLPGKRIVLSTTTKTGNDIARKTLEKDILKFYFPVDFSFAVKNVIEKVNPSLFIMMETEIWPNLISELAKRRIPAVLINGRISERSFAGYRRIRFVFADILRKIDLFCMRTETDAERIRAMGAPGDRVCVTGNMKFDLKEPEKATKHPVDLVGRRGRRPARPAEALASSDLLVAGSIHRGEEEAVLEVYSRLAKRFTGLKLLIAPRHIDRSPDIKRMAEEAGFKSRLFSNLKESDRTGSSEDSVFVLDTFGELKKLYGLATVVFMGGSLIKRGGHNLVEPAIFAKPIAFGPSMFNFRDMAGQFVRNNAAVQVTDKEGLEKALGELLKDKDARASLGQRAKELIEKNRGATERNLESIFRLVSGTGAAYRAERVSVLP